MSFKKVTNITGIAVLLISFGVYFFSVERTTSLWDCGEFILGAYKMQVVHPPGASFFLLVGSLFANFADAVSDNPADIAFAVNLMSGLSSALAAMFIAWSAMILGKLAFTGRDGELDNGQLISLAGAGLAAGLATAFAVSVWFSAVEGEVYAMSTFFTAMTVWAAFKWYGRPDSVQNDKWLLFAVFSIALSTGVHLLSVLVFPVISLMYYFKKYKKHNISGMILSVIAGFVLIWFVLQIVIAGIPQLWTWFELLTVNTMGLPFHSGLVPTILIVIGLIYAGFYFAKKYNNYLMHLLTVSAMLLVIGFSTIGVVVIRANAGTPVNMNVPDDAFRLLPYLNREQYGERPLLKGPHYDARPVDYETTPRYGRVGNRYGQIQEKISPIYADRDMMWFPRVGHNDGQRSALYEAWGANTRKKTSQAFNISFFVRYQLGWMYWRYFAWNFIGKQNANQGYFSWDVSKGNWSSGIKFIDNARLFNTSNMPDSMKNDKANNSYYFLPFLFGLIGLFFHYKKRKKDFAALMLLFLITGIGIIVYSNQPPNEPRERDYVLAGSIMAYTIWIGFGVLGIYNFLLEKIKANRVLLGAAASVVVLSAPLLMGFQNYDDMSRMGHFAARDYAANFLNSCEPNAIIFTYGDNDTYPLWYAQEVEGIRTDVRVVNLSLIAVDWYINKLRRQVNDSPPIKFSLSEESIRGNLRNQMVFFNHDRNRINEPTPLQDVLDFMAGSNPIRGQTTEFPSYIPTKNMYIPVDREKALSNNWVSEADSARIISMIPIVFDENQTFLTKDEIAILDLLANNLYERPVYFSVTVREEKLMGLNDYTQLEGLGLRVVPIRTPSSREMRLYGSGRVHADRLYDNVMNKWTWGEFDTHETFVDESYSPAISAMKMVITRGAQDLMRMGEMEKAADLAKKFFSEFPHFNFPYDYTAVALIEVLLKAGEEEEAKKHTDILVNEIDQYMQFFYSLPEKKLNSFDIDIQRTEIALRSINRLLSDFSDETYRSKVEGILKPYLEGSSGFIQ